ncbi:MAG TPA: sulfur carrier protein ThiS [Beijerinckiaceae bacterium]|jgi:sulfur carrier protein|nr:sulfur carrier protein ThiS [Beijerinckiaceae bacterium]
MVVTVNGEQQEIAATTIPALLQELDYEGEFLVVAVNHDVVQRRRWDEVEIKAGDRIEIVTPRQGG